MHEIHWTQITSEVDVRESIREIGNFRTVCTDNIIIVP